MNSPSNSAPQSPLGSEGVAPVAISATRPLYWSVRRELWENRSIYIAPLAVAGLTLLGFLFASIGGALSTTDLTLRQSTLEGPYEFATTLIMGTAFVVGLFYSLDALHSERRDRSILFWKSLPVSDLTTVLSKAAIPLVVLPAIAFALTVVTHWIMLLLSTVVLRGSGLSAAPLWARIWSLHMELLYHLITVHMLWYAPIYAWILLVSGWARRAAILWAGLPPLAIFIIEKLAFNTSRFATMLRYRISGPETFVFPKPGSHSMMQLNLEKFLSTPGLWWGLVIAAIFLAAAVRLRRYQGPI
ncbi:MAG: ABC transporter permease [Candidatus Sulfotelmatobacter sp.]